MKGSLATIWYAHGSERISSGSRAPFTGPSRSIHLAQSCFA